ncbi:ubiquitin-conjugating enzyme E2 11 [Physcia stellaris]|nr:ubiquitin-conjugating enzyme E2 11 [Physcia stellaris]
MAAAVRIQKELAQMLTNPPPLISVEPVYGDLFQWEATIEGPPNSPYEGGNFHLRIKFPEGYPFSPPLVFSRTPIYHPNVENSGDVRVLHMEDLELSIGISLTQKDKDWTPCVTVEEVLLAIQALLAAPNPHHAIDSTIAQQYMDDRAAFEETARFWTRKYAMRE